MNDKILFYGNSVKEFELFAKYRNELEKEGFELAYATDNRDLLLLLAVQKMLLVNPSVYNSYITVVTNKKYKVNNGIHMTWKEFEETVAK